MAKKKPPETSAQNVRITIDGDVGHTNIIVGDSNQVTSSSQPTLPGEKPPLPRYMPSDELPPPGDLPLGSSLPFPPNPLFTGREAQLRALAETLTPDPSPKGRGGRGGRETSVVINQAVAGMGGVGKTQLAMEFAYRSGRHAPAWVQIRPRRDRRPRRRQAAYRLEMGTRPGVVGPGQTGMAVAG